MFAIEMMKIQLTKHSTFRLKEKQEERGSVQPLAVSIDDIILNSSVIIFT